MEFKEEAGDTYGEPGGSIWMNELLRRLEAADPSVTADDLDRWIQSAHSWIIMVYPNT